MLAALPTTNNDLPHKTRVPRFPVAWLLFSQLCFPIWILVSVGLISDRVMGQDSSPSPTPAQNPPLTWKRVVHLHDGRTFISDGAVALDAALTKARRSESEVLPEASAKTIEGYLTAELPDEFASYQLTRRGETYVAPSGVTLNPIYIDYLRRTLPESRLRFRLKRDLKPVVVLLDGKAVGLLMSMKSASR